MMKKRFIEVDDGLDFSIKHIESGEMFYDCESVVDILNELAEENEQLKQRNNRQAKQLDDLYNLIEQKDWESLTAIIDDFKKAEEQLQREWRTYE